jgi:hypothetical protein
VARIKSNRLLEGERLSGKLNSLSCSTFSRCVISPLEYVDAEYGRFISYSLTQAGRKYVIENLLAENGKQSAVPTMRQPSSLQKSDEIKILILICIGRHGGSCLIDEIAEWFEHGAEPLNAVKRDRHLHDLENQGYIKLHQSPVDFFPSCSLTQKGRAFLDDNNLLDVGENSN